MQFKSIFLHIQHLKLSFLDWYSNRRRAGHVGGGMRQYSNIPPSTRAAAEGSTPVERTAPTQASHGFLPQPNTARWRTGWRPTGP